MSSWIAAATSYSTNNVPMIPFYIYYSMFGLQRVGDLAWLAGDMRARGFLLGGTAGRTTLNGEGLQHEDGHSHILASTIPNCVSYDPTFAYEVVVIVRDGIRRMYRGAGGRLLLHHADERELPAPGHARGCGSGDRQGPVSAEGRRQGQGAARAADGQRHDPARSDRGRRSADDDFKVNADIWSATSFNELRRDGMSAERWSLLHPTQPRRKSYLESALEGHAGPVIAATDYMRGFADQVRSQIPRRYVVLGTDGFGRSDYRVKLRKFFEVNRHYVAVAALKALADDGEIKPEVVDAGDQEVRPRHRAAGSVDGMRAFGIPKRKGVAWQRDRSESAGHRRLQGRAGHRDDGEAGRHGEAGGSARFARVGQGDDGRARAGRGHRQGSQGQGRRQGERRQRDPAARHRRGRGGGARRSAPKTAVSAPPAPTSAPAGIAEVRVPDIGDFKDVPVIEIMVKPGDTVKAEDALVTLESDKATMDVPAPLGGKVQEMKVKVGDKVSEGTLIMTLVTEQRGRRRSAGGTPLPQHAAPAPPARLRHRPRRPRKAGSASTRRAFALAYAGPGVRKLARELGVDLGKVKGSGNNGRILKEDVEGFAKGARRDAEGAAAAPPRRRRRRRHRSLAVAEGRLREVRPDRNASRCRGSRRSPAPTCIATG